MPPLLSVFTPTHNTQYLSETHRSLTHQTCQDFEWVIVPNGSAKIPTRISEDPRVRVVPYQASMESLFMRNIGALKKFACDSCQGELLVELDHDDLLLPHALATLASEFREHPEVGFFYSDCVGFWPDGRSEKFDMRYGWESYEVNHLGQKMTAMRNFPVTARSLAEIYYCPNHVRAWTRAAYERVGGHNPSYKVIDDHELLVRTYLNKVEFRHIDDVLYLYRRHPEAATILDNPLIQIQQAEVRDRYLSALISEWCRREDLEKYDLGGAHNPAPDFKTVDSHGKADLQMSVLSHEFDGAIPDDSVGCFRAYDFLEHIQAGDKVIELMNLLYRKLAPGGWLLTATPSTDGRGAFCDPTHASWWNELSFRYYSDAGYVRYCQDKVRCRYQVVKLATVYQSQWHVDNKLPYVVCDMSALKGQRQPGLQLI